MESPQSPHNPRKQLQGHPLRYVHQKHLKGANKMKFKNKNHQAIFTTAANKLNRNDNVKMSVLYLLTADVRLWNASKHHIKKGYIDLDSIKVKNGNIKAYTLLCVAKDIACGEKRYANIHSSGVMGMATYTDDEAVVRSDFRKLKHISDMLHDWIGESGNVDADCREKLAAEVKRMLEDEALCQTMRANVLKMALCDADEKIVDAIYQILETR